MQNRKKMSLQMPVEGTGTSAQPVKAGDVVDKPIVLSQFSNIWK